MTGVAADDARAVLRRHRFLVREATERRRDPTYLYGDRHRCTKMATLLTHTGLVLFLVAAAVTSRLGDEQGLVVAEGESLTVQPIGTPGLLLVRNLEFEAPGFDTGQAVRLHDRPRRLPGRQADRAQDHPRQRPARRSAATRSTRTASGRRRTSSSATRRQAALGRAGPDDRLGGRPVRHDGRPGPRRRPPAAARQGGRRHRDPARAPVPRGRDQGRRDADRGPTRVALAKGETGSRRDRTSRSSYRGSPSYTLLIAKKDPGQGIIWLAFAS